MLKNFIITIILVSFIIVLATANRVFAPNGILPEYTLKVPEFFNKNPIKEVKLLFVGDIMMDRNIRTVAEKKGYDFYFECAKPTFEKYDYVIANLEGPVTNFQSVSRVKTVEDPNLYRFTMSEKVLSAVKNSGIDVVSIVNNHIYDYGKEGIKQTGENILASDLSYFGDPINLDFKTLTLQKDGINFHLVPFNEFSSTSNETISLINNFASSSDPIIVFTHWGDEYTPASDRVKKLARNFVDLGADIIIGTHPHVLQEVEIYKDKPIFYSLGNFIFDQYWMESVKNGGAAEIVLKNNGEITSRLLPVSLDLQLRPCISE